MEEPGNSRPDKGRRAQKIKVKGNGFVGLVVLGGAFAIAALMANNKRRKQNNGNQQLPTEPTKKLKSNNEDESVGLRSLLEVESSSIVETHRCCRISLEQGVSKTVSTESQITETRITEETIHVDEKEIANGDQEIVQVVSEVQFDSVSDDIPIAQDGNPPSPSEAIIGHVADVITMEEQCLDVLSKEDGVTAEGDSPKVEPVDDIVVEENQAVQVEILDYSDGGSLSSEEVSVIGKDELCEITSSGIVEENPPEELEIVNDKEDEDDSNCNEDEDYDSDNDGDDEKEGEGSEGTGESSMESNSEAIWPAESLEEESLLLKDMNSQLHNLRHKFNEEGCKVVQKEDKASQVKFASGKESMFKLVQHPRFMLSRAGFITWAILAVGLLLLLLGHQLPMFYQLYSSQMSS